MEEFIKLGIGIIFLLLGIPFGSLLAKLTSEELCELQKYFKIILISGLILGIVGLIIREDFLLFTGFFIAIVTCKSLKK